MRKVYLLPFSFYLRVVRWAFARFYREFAWTYDAVAWLVSRGLWRGWTLTALPYLRGRVLELGCGTGYVQHALASAAQAEPRSVVGFDASPQMLRLTRQRVARTGHVARLARGVAQALPFASASFDTVLATFPAEYILHPTTVAEIRRVLTSDGRIIIVDGAQFTNTGLYERVTDLAYRVTLQASVREAPSSALRLPHFEEAGFRFDHYWERVGPSRVMVMEGTLVDHA